MRESVDLDRVHPQLPHTIMQLETLKNKEAADERIMFSIAQENKRMSEPMRKALEEVRQCVRLFVCAYENALITRYYWFQCEKCIAIEYT